MAAGVKELFAEFTDTHQVLDSLTDDQKEELLGIACLRVFSDQQEIARIGEPVDGIYFIVEGSLRLEIFSESGERFLIGDLQSGDVFGMLSVIDQQSSIHYAHSVGTSRTIFISGSKFRNFIFSDPDLTRLLVDIMCQRLRMSLILVNRFAPGSLALRVVRCLVGMTDNQGFLPEHRNHVQVAINQFDLASMLSVSRQSVNRVLKDLEAKGMVEIGYNVITVHDLSRLRDLL